MKGLVRIVIALSLPVIFSGCTKDAQPITESAHTQELKAAEQMYGPLGFDRHQAWPLYTLKRDSTGNPISNSSTSVAQCVEL